MGKTPITPLLLQEKGFEEKTMFGNICYVKDNVAIVYNFQWLPCNLETGKPLSTLITVNTYEDLEKIVKEGGLSI